MLNFTSTVSDLNLKQVITDCGNPNVCLVSIDRGVNFLLLVKQEWLQKFQASLGLMLGDKLLSPEWGGSQSNADFYEVSKESTDPSFVRCSGLPEYWPNKFRPTNLGYRAIIFPIEKMAEIKNQMEVAKASTRKLGFSVEVLE